MVSGLPLPQPHVFAVLFRWKARWVSQSCIVVSSPQHGSTSPAFVGYSPNIAFAPCAVTIGISNIVCMLPPPVAPPRGVFIRLLICR